MAVVIEKKVQYAWAGWALLFLAASTAILLNGLRSTMPIYRYAALAWVQGQRIYELSGIGGFTYFPQAAILLVPFAVLPAAVGEVAWRLVSIGVFVFAFRELSGLLRERAGKDFFPLMTLVAIPMVWDCARNGQATLLMAALMLLAVTDIARNRWWLATLWLCLAVSVKPLAIVLILLVMAIDRAMSWRLVVGLLVTTLVPFLTQHPAYVVEQYRACFQNMTTAAHVGVVAHGWTTPFTALRVWGLDVPEKVQTVIRLAAALGTLGLCFFARRRYDASRSAVFVYSLAALYLILFSPRTENNTYAMLGPVAGYFVANAVLLKHRITEGTLLGGLALVMVSSRVFEQLLAPGRERIWLSPLLASLLAVYVIGQMVSEVNHDRKA
jgi:hypothetical protein